MTEQERGRTSRNRYEGWRGGARILWEVLSDAPAVLREDIAATASKLRNEPIDDGVECGIKDCERHGVSMHERKKRYRDPISLCRRHWLGVNIAILGVYAVVLSIIGAGFALAIGLVMAA